MNVEKEQCARDNIIWSKLIGRSQDQEIRATPKSRFIVLCSSGEYVERAIHSLTDYIVEISSDENDSTKHIYWASIRKERKLVSVYWRENIEHAEPDSADFLFVNGSSSSSVYRLRGLEITDFEIYDECSTEALEIAKYISGKYPRGKR